MSHDTATTNTSNPISSASPAISFVNETIIAATTDESSLPSENDALSNAFNAVASHAEKRSMDPETRKLGKEIVHTIIDEALSDDTIEPCEKGAINAAFDATIDHMK